MKKIAICGHTSNLGKTFIKNYSEQYDIVTIGRRNADVKMDLINRVILNDVSMLQGCSAMINFAAQVEDDGLDRIVDMIQVNTVGPLFLAELSRKYEMNVFVNISSISAIYDETDPYYNYYAQTKKSAEELLRLYCKKNNIPLCILRPSSIWGDECFACHQPLIYGFIDKIKRGEDITIYGSLDAKRNYIHSTTVCEVIRQSVEKKVTGTYNVVNQKNDSLTEMIQVLNTAYAGHSEVKFDKNKPNVIGREFHDNGEIYRILGMEYPNGLEIELQMR